MGANGWKIKKKDSKSVAGKAQNRKIQDYIINYVH